MNTKTISLIGIFFFLYLFFVYDTDFHGPDEPIYCAYTASIVEDGDLNAVNHLNQKYPYYLPDGKVGVSKTYNLPDYHNHGGVIFWVPFYLYAKFAYFFISKFRLNYGIDDFINCSMSFSTILFGFLAVLLTFLFCKIFFSWLAALWSTLIMFLGTPFFYFLLSEVGNAQILAMLLSILSIWFCSYVIGRKKSHWFLYGLFLSMCVIVKIIV